MLLYALLACGSGRLSGWAEGRDPIGRFEHGDGQDPDFSFYAWDVQGIQCQDADGVNWLYVHASTRTTGGDCSSGSSFWEDTGWDSGWWQEDPVWDTQRDSRWETGRVDTGFVGPGLDENYGAGCSGLSEAFRDVEGRPNARLRCGEGIVPSNRLHQVSLWFSGFDPQWPMDADFISGVHKSCDDDEVPEGIEPSIGGAFFTPDEYSDELLVSGGVHGVARVEYCRD